MLDPVAVRSYLGSLGQQGGGQGGGVQAMLANLRQRLYGPQAQGGAGQGIAKPPGMNQTPGINPNAPGGAVEPGLGGKPTLSGTMTQTPGINPNAPASPAAGMPNGLPPRLQALAAKDPAAAQARYAQFQAGQLPGQQGQAPLGGNIDQSAGGAAQPTLSGPPMQQGRVPQGLRDVLQANAGQLGGLPDQGFPAGGPRGTFGELPLQQPGGLGGPGSDRGYQVGVAGGYGSDLGFQSGGGLMGAPVAPTPPDFWTPDQIAQATANTANGILQPQTGGGLQAPPAGPAVKPAAPAGRQASPAVLGADQFRGPNRQRIVNARQGIFNNVQQALRRPPARPPAPGRPPAGGKVGMR